MTRDEWLVQIVVRASKQELDAVTERVGDAICVPADHEGPCQTPWTLVTVALDDLDDGPEWRALLDRP